MINSQAQRGAGAAAGWSLEKPAVGKAGRRAAIYLVLVLHLVVTGYPFVWMVLSSFKSNKEYFANPRGLPIQWEFENYGARSCCSACFCSA
ncbi:hypothetical protein KP806_16305 [Paenibacillus sp. N4]|uniref:hypothetical protein n=1 Tax=Paenibacillus vietnamensis TaxID=2590547 RepID=UPI001CD05C07|nr:hypothetical protein [Paenibacillus vietnamensis]MCA0756620.1 hypothetical protein [Paenibacillus vietnamensis]